MKFPDKLFEFGLIATLVTFLALSWTVMVFAQQGDDDQLQLGAQIYTENCAVCHGPNGEGRVGATLAKNWPSIRPDLATRATIADGVPGTAMPAWSQDNEGPLTEAEIDAVVSYILSWQTGGAPEITPHATATSRPAISPVPEVQGDPNQGAILYDGNCAVCHGVNGEGRIGVTLAKNWGSIRPDLAIRSTIASGVTGTAMPAWSQENGGPLTEDEIDDIVAFVMSWPVPAEPATVTPDSPIPSRWIGWGGVILTIFLFVFIVIIVLEIQKPKQEQ
jgi:mono/diheme cytochrome c family protein